MTRAILELTGISRRYGVVQALHRAALTVLPGEIHAVVGENGAGKSTLLKIAAGLERADAGEVRVDGRLLSPLTAANALSAGIGMVQQHFSLLPAFTVAENIVLGAEPRRGPVLDRAAASERIRGLAARFGLEIDPTQRVEDLSVGEQQRVEILRVLHREVRILVLDEPTTVLAPSEVDALFLVLRALAREGRSVVFVTHKLREVLALADRVSVLRRGESLGTFPVSETSLEQLTLLMVGDQRGSEAELREPTIEPGAPPALSVQDLTVRDPSGRTRVDRVSLELRRGEIVGVAGVQGNGQSELVDAVAGLVASSGQVHLDGGPIHSLDVIGRYRAGLAHIPEDRHRRGLVLEKSVAENLALGRLDRFAPRGWFDAPALREAARQALEAYEIRPPDAELPVGMLSGGNQQKVVVARELARGPRVLLAAQPTRGVDVAASQAIHRALRDAAARGTAILLVSADLTELLALCTRILVMYRGAVAGELPRAQATEVRLGAWMVGGRSHG